ncbi:MAG: hypothetical protein WDW36_004905 [Sanguina aurantia]
MGCHADLLAARTGAKKTLFHDVSWQYQTDRHANGRMAQLKFELPGDDPGHPRSATAADQPFKFEEDDTPRASDTCAPPGHASKQADRSATSTLPPCLSEPPKPCDLAAQAPDLVVSCGVVEFGCGARLPSATACDL